MAEITDKAREEFFSEAQELIEALSKALLILDGKGKTDPEAVNDAFRAVHTLKGLSGLFGVKAMGTLSHKLEDALDKLRLGKIDLDEEVLDVLFEAVDLYNQLLASERAGEPATAPIDAFIARLEGNAAQAPQPGSLEAGEFDLDPGLVAVLTEYEEHRLRANIEEGLQLYRIRVDFELATIDRALEEFKVAAKPLGEIITYLPTGEASSPDTLQLDLLLASASATNELERTIGAANVAIHPIPRKAKVSKRPTPMAPQEEMPRAPTPSLVAIPSDMPPSHAPGAQMVKSIAQTVRVDIRKLDVLMNVVGELALVKAILSRLTDRLRADGERQTASELARIHRSFDRKLGELQSGILEVRMVPLGQVFDRLARVVRQIGREVKKEIRLVITGAETEIDKLIVEELSDPLMHMVRNSIDHGIEASHERQRVGKPIEGTIALNAFQKGNHVVIEIEDDGKGIDEDTLVSRAIQVGAIPEDQARQLTRDEVLALIFLPGVSTREQASDYSGRGVGMDVVKTNIGKLGGVVDVHSEPGIGTKFTITLPITLAIVSALLVRLANRMFAIPLTSVTEAIQLEEKAVRLVDGREVMTLRGATLPLCRLEKLFQLAGGDAMSRRFVVVASLGARRLGFIVDHLIGQQDIVIKPLGKSLARVRGFAGATELGDQRVALVLDAASLIDEVLSGVETVAKLGRLHG